MLICVNFHYVRPSYDSAYPSFFGVTPEQFGARLDLLAGAGEFVGAEDIRAAVRGERDLPERCWAITFDDGLREQYEHAWPLLRERGIPAIFFVNTDPIASHRLAGVHKIHQLRACVAPERVRAALDWHAEQMGLGLPEVDPELAARQYKYDTREAAMLKYLLNIHLTSVERDQLVDACFSELVGRPEADMARELYMTPAQVRTLAEHGCIGTHAHHHLPLGTLERGEIELQISSSLALLGEWTGRETYTLSYPYGAPEACSEVAGQVAAGAGIEFAFTMERAGNREFDAPYFIARCDNNDLPGGKAARWELDRVFEEIPPARWHRPAMVGGETVS